MEVGHAVMPIKKSLRLVLAGLLLLTLSGAVLAAQDRGATKQLIRVPITGTNPVNVPRCTRNTAPLAMEWRGRATDLRFNF